MRCTLTLALLLATPALAQTGESSGVTPGLDLLDPFLGDWEAFRVQGERGQEAFLAIRSIQLVSGGVQATTTLEVEDAREPPGTRTLRFQVDPGARTLVCRSEPSGPVHHLRARDDGNGLLVWERQEASGTTLVQMHPPVDGRWRVSVTRPTGPEATRTRTATYWRPGTRVQGQGLTFTIDPTWGRLPTRTPLERMVLLLPGDEGSPEGRLVLYHFGPAGRGSVEENLQRWMAQFSAPGGGAPTSSISTRDVGECRTTVLEVSGTYHPPARGAPPRPEITLWAAIIEGPGGPWYLKAMAPRSVLARHLDRLTYLITTLQPSVR